MSGNIGVVDWFTKVRKELRYPEKSEELQGDLIKKLKSVASEEQNLDRIAQRVYEIIRESEYYNDICADPRLPVCSLFHQTKNTSAIAVCLAFDQIKPDGVFIQDCLKHYELADQACSLYRNVSDFIGLIRLCALFHDIGKPGSFNASHQEYSEFLPVTREIVQTVLSSSEWDSLVKKYNLDRVLLGVYKNLEANDLKSPIDHFIRNADMISSQSNRIYEVSFAQEFSDYPGTTEEVMLPLLEKGGLRVEKDFFLRFPRSGWTLGIRILRRSPYPRWSAEWAAFGRGGPRACTARSSRKSSGSRRPRRRKWQSSWKTPFRSVNIALINEIAVMSNRLKIDIWEVIEAAKTKPFGFMPFYPGPGIGGHCLPIDPLYLSWKSRMHGFEAKMIELASEINQPDAGLRGRAHHASSE